LTIQDVPNLNPLNRKNYEDYIQSDAGVGCGWSRCLRSDCESEHKQSRGCGEQRLSILMELDGDEE